MRTLRKRLSMPSIKYCSLSRRYLPLRSSRNRIFKPKKSESARACLVSSPTVTKPKRSHRFSLLNKARRLQNLHNSSLRHFLRQYHKRRIALRNKTVKYYIRVPTNEDVSTMFLVQTGTDKSFTPGELESLFILDHTVVPPPRTTRLR